jgi:hypothetical protein
MHLHYTRNAKNRGGIVLAILAIALVAASAFSQEETKSIEKWNIDPRMTVVRPTGEIPPPVTLDPNFKQFTTEPRVIHTALGTLTVSPNVRVHPSTITSQSEVPITRHPTNPDILYGSSNSYRAATGFISEGMYLSTNGGTSWFGSDTTSSATITNHSGDPAPAIAPNGYIYNSYLYGASTIGVGVARSTNMGTTWGSTTVLTSVSSDKNHTFVNDIASSPYYGYIFVTWSNFSASLPPTVVSYSSNNGTSWTAMATVLTPATGHYHQGVNGAVGINGDAYICWQNPVTTTGNVGDYVGFAKSTNGGATWTATNNVYDCNGARTSSLSPWSIRLNDFPSMAVDKSGGARNGWIYIVTCEKNLSPAGTDEDIVMHRSTDGGTTWSAGIRVNQDAVSNGKKQYMPWMCADEGGGINVIYYDNRNSTAGDSVQVMVSRSVDGGATWTDIVVSDHKFKPAAISGLATGYQGDYISITAGNGKIFPYWCDNSSGSYQAWTATLTTGPTITVSAPNGGETWGVGSSQTITWTSTNVLGNVNIDLSTNGGTTFPIAVATNTVNDGSEVWTVTGPATTQARIRVTSVMDATIRDSSNANFTIIQPTVTVTSPNGGESWGVGSSQTVTWTSTNLSGNVRIDLSTDGGATFPTIVAASTSNDGAEPWTVPAPATGAARIRIMSVADATVRDSSNANFTVIQPTVTVASPNGGESWLVGTSQTLTWSSTNLSSNVRIDLSTDGGATFPTTIAASTANDGAEAWTVPAAPTAAARIRIMSVADATVRDSSNANFNIIQPSITVTSPNGGESWPLGSAQTITWTSSNLSGNVTIELSTDGGATFPTMIAANTANDGSEPWTVAGAPCATARIRITSISFPTVFDASNTNFSIVQPTITVLSPNGGEAWTSGTTQTILWTSTNLTGNVKIELSLDGGVTYPTVIAANTANDGSESWTLPGSGSSMALIRITSVNLPSVLDVSDNYFTILYPTVTVTAPNGGEIWGIGTIQTIHWSTAALTGNVKVELSRDGGTTYETLFGSTPNDGTEAWTITGGATTNARVRVSSVSFPSIFDSSDAPFTISVSFAFITQLYVHDNGGEHRTLEFGAAAGATDGLDATYGEEEQPPMPPAGVFDARWKLVGTQGLLRDMRDTLSATHQQITYTGLLQPGGGGYPFVLRWDRLSLPAGSFVLKDNLGGTEFLVNMKLQDSLVITNSDVTQFQIIYGLSTSVSTTMETGWGMVSVPVTVPDLRKSTLFPGIPGSTYAYTPTGYQVRDTLGYGRGYWLKFPAAQTVTMTGAARTRDTMDVVTGWNMIGTVTDPVSVAGIVQIPASIVTSSYFGYIGGIYTPVSSIEPMKSYWVKVNQNGKLVLTGGTAGISKVVIR